RFVRPPATARFFCHHGVAYARRSRFDRHQAALQARYAHHAQLGEQTYLDGDEISSYIHPASSPYQSHEEGGSARMKVLVTGANGLLATNTIIALLSRGYRVKGLIRDTRKFLLPLQDHLELAVGDITDPLSLDEAIAGCDYIIHCAATTDQRLLRYADYHRINVRGTENIIHA